MLVLPVAAALPMEHNLFWQSASIVRLPVVYRSHHLELSPASTVHLSGWRFICASIGD